MPEVLAFHTYEKSILLEMSADDDLVRVAHAFEGDSMQVSTSLVILTHAHIEEE